MPAVMHIIPFSHFNEKGMWILDYKGIEYDTKPLANPANRSEIAALTGGTTSLPVFHDGDTVIGDTTELALTLDERIPEPRLVPANDPERSEVLLWEDWADNSIGPHIRRWLFHTLRVEAPEKGVALFMSTGMSEFKAKLGWRIMAPKITKAMGANAVSAQVSFDQMNMAMDILNVRLQGRDFLVGDSFTLADLTVCSLLAPATLIGPWLEDARWSRVAEWRTGIMEAHGRRQFPTDPLPDRAERLRRGKAAAGALAPA